MNLKHISKVIISTASYCRFKHLSLKNLCFNHAGKLLTENIQTASLTISRKCAQCIITGETLKKICQTRAEQSYEQKAQAHLQMKLCL